MNYTPPPTSKTPSDKAIEFVCNRCFHRSLILPETSQHGPLRVSFATTTNFDEDERLPAVLYCSPMGASRYMLMDLNHTAREAGVRMVLIDRPGVGGSDPVPLQQRIDTWIETVPAVLKKLGVRHVALASHSAGTMYLLNTLLRLPDILDPGRPFAVLSAPFVHMDHSNVGFLNLASKLPQSWIGGWDHIQNFVGGTVVPSVGYSAGILEGVADVFRSNDSTAVSEDASKIMDAYGFDKETYAELGKVQGAYARSESTSGISQDTLLCLKKGGSFWGACDDYSTYIDDLVKQLKERQKSGQMEKKLRLVAQFAESDIMIGKEGQRYFEECFGKEGVSGVVDFDSVVVPKTNHETIVSARKPALRAWLGEVRAMY